MTENEKDEIFPFINGEIIDLVAQTSKSAALLCKWFNNPKVRRYSRNMWPKTLEEIKKWFEPSQERGVKNFIVFNIYHKKDKQIIGNIGFSQINWVNRNANLFATIGIPEYWGKGIVIEAAELVINYGFTELNFHKIYVGIFNLNNRSLRAAEKLGFKKEAVLKGQEYVDGKYIDEHKFALFKEDWLRKRN